MKRRAFLAAASLFSLFGTNSAFAAKKKDATKSSSKKASSKSGKSSGKSEKKSSSRSERRSSRRSSRKSENNAPQAPNSAENSVVESPPAGSSATRLPPVKAPEPPDIWRTHEVTTTIQLKSSRGRQRLWLPLPLNQDTLYQRTLGHTWQGNFDLGSLRRLPDGDLEAFYCEWQDGIVPQLTLTTTVTTADRHFDISRRTLAPEREDILRRNLQATQFLPNEGSIRTLGEQILGRIKDPVAQAKAIYDWVVDNTEYDTLLPGCGIGDVRRQMELRHFGGRSADINGLFVALCRAIGVPARRVFGRRIDRSRISTSLGVMGDATLAPHCRAEFYVPGYSWIPVDPSDVRRIIALEGLDHRDGKLIAIKKLLFGVWEMNWMAYNVAEDLTLPGDGAPLPFFTLPELHTSSGNFSFPNPDAGTFQIRSSQIL